MLVKLLFKKQEPYPDDVRALIELSVSMRVRMDKIVHGLEVDQPESLAA